MGDLAQEWFAQFGVVGPGLVPDFVHVALAVDVDGIARRGLRYERLDQLAMEHLLGARG